MIVNRRRVNFGTSVNCPTIIITLINKVIIIKDPEALLADSNFSSFFPSGKLLDKLKKIATAANTPATIK